MIGMGINAAKSNFLDRQAVIERVGKARAGVFMRGGGLIRTVARRSMRKARQKKIAELSAVERQRFKMLQAIYKRKGLNPRKVRRPLVHSRPGEPPRTIRGDIKKFLFFAFDHATESVVIGPARTPRASNAPATLEEGGRAVIDGRSVTIAPRPYMVPAREQTEKPLMRLWKDAMHKHYS